MLTIYLNRREGTFRQLMDEAWYWHLALKDYVSDSGTITHKSPERIAKRYYELSPLTSPDHDITFSFSGKTLPNKDIKIYYDGETVHHPSPASRHHRL